MHLFSPSICLQYCTTCSGSPRLLLKIFQNVQCDSWFKCHDNIEIKRIQRGGAMGVQPPLEQRNLWFQRCFQAPTGAQPPSGKKKLSPPDKFSSTPLIEIVVFHLEPHNFLLAIFADKNTLLSRVNNISLANESFKD